MLIKASNRAASLEEELHACFQAAGISERAFTWLGLLVCLLAWPCHYRLEWRNYTNLHVRIGQSCFAKRDLLEDAIAKVAKDQPVTVTIIWEQTAYTWIGYGPDW